jgi:hypothetical protein
VSFLTEYFGIVEGTKEQAVYCPFDHHTASGIPYKETRPSAHVNTMENLFHCKACNTGLSETQFIEKILGCDYAQARKLQLAFSTDETLAVWEDSLSLTEETKQRALALGISEEVLEELKIRTPTPPYRQNVISFPVFMFDHLIDIRNYDPGHQPKIRSRKDALAGLIIPYDIWRDTDTNKVTLICAGEKDMAVARSNGFNAITITGGERALPLPIEDFRNRKVAICYDNDDTGIEGAKNLANCLLKVAKEVKVVTNFHEVCKEKGEDITDFFTKYNKTRDDLINFIRSTPAYTYTETEKKKVTIPTITLQQASTPKYLNQLVKTNVQVVATMDQVFTTPTSVIAEKTRLSGKDDTLAQGDIREWKLTEDNVADLLHLIDNNFKEEQVKDNLKTRMYIPAKERNILIKRLAEETVYKANVTDLFETQDVDIQPMEYTCYSLGTKLESGKKYLVTHKIIPHPYKGQQLIMLITAAEQASDSVTNFRITPEVRKNLDVIKNIECHTAEQKLAIISRKVKGLLGYDGNDLLIQAIDLSYHTALAFDFGSFKNVRGYLETLIVGESRMGKSSTATILQKVYGLGAFVSLAGNSATIAGLVGGANKSPTGGYQTRAGVIPQNHKGLIIFEELGKCSANILAELTDIRSSNEVRIARVSGTMTLPAWVRMLTLTNTKHVNNQIKPIASYPNGISIITELVPTAEDIARYDLMVILGDRGNTNINPLWEPEAPYPTEVYRTRIRWIWSRTPEQIIFSDTVKKNIIEEANKLNKEFECHIKIFGTECWKKICRLAIAIAGYCVSTDDTYENIVVTSTHVSAAVKFLRKIYDNPIFKLKEYVQHEKLFSTTDEEAIALLQDIWNKTPGIVQQLEQYASVTKNMLAATTGLGNEELNRTLNRLTKGLFIRVSNFEIAPTERFRLTLARIERNTHINPLGEG